MATSPPRPCRHPQCAETQPCPVHGVRAEPTHRQRLEATPWRRLYSTRRWRRLSQRVRARTPVCEACKASGRTPRPTRHVDHIRPAREAWARGELRGFWAESGLQAFCARCHSEKTRREQLGHE
jgi:5-methylcytosine-specific restriction protein A